ncbi:MAG: 23S rRNA (adenine(2503)-C(2))-methyltransferase RlmN [Bacteroidales bacterium]|nr:MAG: 23S rRNA (adenine(2503)-C(2))-methyltransferase RlmN [Bacteroidales bacterium]
METESLLGKTIDDIKKIVVSATGQEEHAIEIAKWIYRKGASTFDEMNTIPLALRKKLDKVFSIGKYNPIQVCESKDKTRKYLYKNQSGQQFESVYMPSPKRNTLCISTQSGCRMGCAFCLTGKIGFKGNLLAMDILNQYLSIHERKKINRIVIMGMGEPFDNFNEVKNAVKILTAEWGAAFGASNITLSTVGLHESLREFLEKPFCNLAVSLNNPFSDERKSLMPIESTNPIAEAVNFIKQKPLKKPLRVSFEYVALSGVNTYKRHAIAIAQMLSGINYHLNIIPWNGHEKSSFKPPSDIELNAFIDCLNQEGILTAVRQSRGQDIGAACGQMAGESKNLKEKRVGD